MAATIFICVGFRFVIPSEVEESLAISETSRDLSTSVEMTFRLTLWLK